MSWDVSIRGGRGAIGIELIFADDLQHAPFTLDSERPLSWSLSGMIVSSRLLVPHKINAARRSHTTNRLRRTNPAGGGRSTTMLRLSALGLRRDPHGSVKQIHHEELEDGEKERPSEFPKIMLKQTDSR